MKRFIDIRNQGTCSRFAWYDTVKEKFEIHSGWQDWDTWAQFEEVYEGRDLQRYKDLCPAWAFYEEGSLHEYISEELENWGDMEQVEAEFCDYNAIRMFLIMCTYHEIQEKIKILESHGA